MQHAYARAQIAGTLVAPPTTCRNKQTGGRYTLARLHILQPGADPSQPFPITVLIPHQPGLPAPALPDPGTNLAAEGTLCRLHLPNQPDATHLALIAHTVSLPDEPAPRHHMADDEPPWPYAPRQARVMPQTDDYDAIPWHPDPAPGAPATPPGNPAPSRIGVVPDPPPAHTSPPADPPAHTRITRFSAHATSPPHDAPAILPI